MGSCQVTFSPLALRRFPPEIRSLIFAHTAEYNGKTPNIIKALRGDEELYCEALELMYKVSTFWITTKNKYNISLMSEHVMSNVQRLHIS